eukprot:gnl/MRDRNA2_/MRDRNA2_75194_c0_seq1.p1 gnl/MRDRNA2_/MRDRNA2_75194_c0~~gnl/MRDRNA2_/MRDRNA2_75194_c0_seq1.p1  ORF type:complete len:389 (+),score=47.04 gnl/MRDRNA2_/MRDRNA2_75194_c0_seq1:46-1167(+)
MGPLNGRNFQFRLTIHILVFLLPQPLFALRRVFGPFRSHAEPNVAVGVVTGGPNMASRISAVRSTWLKEFKQTVVMGDRDLEEEGVEAPPSKFWCSPDSPLRNATGGDKDQKAWTARGRCTQQRFLYLLLQLRERYPNAAFYMLVDDDTWLDSTGVKSLMLSHDPWLPLLIGYKPDHGFKKFLWGGPGYIFSNALMKRLDPKTVMTQASLWEFACSFRDCCDSQKCYAEDHPAILEDFARCNNHLLQECDDEAKTKNYKSCVRNLAEIDEHRCHYEKTVPEYPTPMYYEPKWGGSNFAVTNTSWDAYHGSDHVLSFAVKQVGGELIGEPRFSWRHKKFDQHGTEACNVLAQHKLNAEEIVDWHQKWNTQCDLD